MILVHTHITNKMGVEALKNVYDRNCNKWSHAEKQEMIEHNQEKPSNFEVSCFGL